MRKGVLLNVLLNVALAAIFVMLNQWALHNHLEETFVTLALFYGCIVTIGNALFISMQRTL